jgi:GNAT superfamily N-acetyltransferase
MPTRYPKEAALRDGRRVLIRPFTAQDPPALFEFFQSLPDEVRRFAWDNIDDPGLLESWGRQIDYAKVLPIVALDGQRIVADATLHRRDRGPLRRVGRINWLLDPGYRGQGLGTTLVNDFIAIARTQGLRNLTCMLVAELEADAIATLRHLGFDKYPIPAYATDLEGNQHDMVKLVLQL